jgi:transcriptional regulator with XRE-family HTH domain
MTGIDGALLRAWRRARGLAVPELARKLQAAARDLGVSVADHDGLVRMIYAWERGDHAISERYELIYQAAGFTADDDHGDTAVVEATPLRAPRGMRDPVAPFGERPPAIIELSEVLTSYGFDPCRLGSGQLGKLPSLAGLERDVRIAFDAYQQSRLTVAASRIVMLLADAQLAARECPDTDRPRALKVLALSYQAAATVLAKVGETDLAWIAAERGLSAAEASGSPLVRGSLIRSVVFVLHSTCRFEAAMRLADASADSLHEGISRDNAMLSVYGTLLLTASMAAARFGDGPRTADYLRESGRAAQWLGTDGNYLWTSFGPTNVAIHRVNTAVELHDFQTVLDSGLSLDTTAVPAERRVRYVLDVARVYALTGRKDDALGAMLTAERIAPEQVRQHYLSRKVVMTLIRSTPGKPAPELSKLAARVKISEPR